MSDLNTEYRVAFRPLAWRGRHWSDTPGEIRLRHLLKAAADYGLKATRIEEPPSDPCAWDGWLLFAAGWARVCCARTEDGCARLLLERQDKGILNRRVLLRGETPQEEAQP